MACHIVASKSVHIENCADSYFKIMGIADVSAQEAEVGSFGPTIFDVDLADIMTTK